MKTTFLNFLKELDTMCEVVYVDENDNILTEAAIQAFKRTGQQIKRYYRCTSGDKAGRLVSSPKACAIRKSPQKVRHGMKVMRRKHGLIMQKSRITKKRALSKLVTNKNISISKHKK